MRYISSEQGLFTLTPVVKYLLKINVAVWFLLVIIYQGMMSGGNTYIYHYLGLSPLSFLEKFWIWQILSYSFVHSSEVFHIFFNCFALAMFGVELEKFWGGRFFLLYYLVCSLGAGIVYLVIVKLGVVYFSVDPLVYRSPLIGASGAIFGILFAYGIIFSERIIYFLMIFPMKAIHFTLIVAGIELVSLINSGVGSPVSHLRTSLWFCCGVLVFRVLEMVSKSQFKETKKNRSAFS